MKCLPFFQIFFLIRGGWILCASKTYTSYQSNTNVFKHTHKKQRQLNWISIRAHGFRGPADAVFSVQCSTSIITSLMNRLNGSENPSPKLKRTVRYWNQFYDEHINYSKMHILVYRLIQMNWLPLINFPFILRLNNPSVLNSRVRSIFCCCCCSVVFIKHRAARVHTIHTPKQVINKLSEMASHTAVLQCW